MTNESKSYQDVQVQEVLEDDLDDQSPYKHLVGMWVVQFPNGLDAYFYDEENACLFQRMWREAHGMDPITGNEVK